MWWFFVFYVDAFLLNTSCYAFLLKIELVDGSLDLYISFYWFSFHCIMVLCYHDISYAYCGIQFYILC